MHTVTKNYESEHDTWLPHCYGGWMSRLAYGSLLLACSCSSSQTDNDSTTQTPTTNTMPDTTVAEAPVPEEETFHADNDIAMTVRSVADAINVGEPIDSADYNFSGVLTDGLGTPLFTDFEGFPGQWVVDVVSHREVKIQNIGTGDLMPGSLIEYIAASLNSDENDDSDLQYIDSYDSGDAQVELYTYGRTSLKVVTRPELLPTGEVGPKLEITLLCDTLDS